MPYAVTHVILTIVIADIYRDYIAKKRFPMIYVFIAGVAGLLPDMDIPAGWAFNYLFRAHYNFHRIYTHSLTYAILFLAIAVLFLFLRKREYKILGWNMSKHVLAMFFFAMAFGWLMHVGLDCMLAADGYLNLVPSIPLKFCPHPFSNQALVGFDAIILLLWLVHEQWRHKIKDYF